MLLLTVPLGGSCVATKYTVHAPPALERVPPEAETDSEQGGMGQISLYLTV